MEPYREGFELEHGENTFRWKLHIFSNQEIHIAVGFQRGGLNFRDQLLAIPSANVTNAQQIVSLTVNVPFTGTDFPSESKIEN
jgi:hypothetical protein